MRLVSYRHKVHYKLLRRIVEEAFDIFDYQHLFHWKFCLVIRSFTINIHTKFQLNLLSCSRDIVVATRGYFVIVDFRAFRKNSMQNQRFNIFLCGLHQTSSNSCLYHICENERNRK
jgi:hypothetical protein